MTGRTLLQEKTELEKKLHQEDVTKKILHLKEGEVGKTLRRQQDVAGKTLHLVDGVVGKTILPLGVVGKTVHQLGVVGKFLHLLESVAGKILLHQELHIAGKKLLLEIVAIEMTAVEENLLQREIRGGDLQAAHQMMKIGEGEAEGVEILTSTKLIKEERKKSIYCVNLVRTL